MRTERHIYQWQGRDYPVVLRTMGLGKDFLFLPALSSISTAAEMLPLVERLALPGRVVLADWPAFGTADAPAGHLAPDLLRSFLPWLLARLGNEPPAVVAAGHGASYVLAQEQAASGSFARIAMVAPTWRGPLRVMMDGERPLQERLRHAVGWPVLGPLLYALNLSRPVVVRMLKAHVLDDPSHLTADYLAGKQPVIRRRNARFATAAFVTGALDPFSSRDAWLAAAWQAKVPLLAIVGGRGPARSEAEMAALADAGIRTVWLGKGRLGVHEEYPNDVASELRPFLLAETSPA